MLEAYVGSRPRCDGKGPDRRHDRSITTKGRLTMSTESGRVRASDAEREEFATLVREAVGEGRLTLAEGDERLATIYAAKFRDELRPLVADLPSAARADVTAGPRSPYDRRRQWEARWQGPRPRGAFARHVAVVVAVTVALTGLWVISGAHFFWPAIPLFFITLGLVRHARWRAYHRR
jgi:uncharacterized protein DUF1707